MKNAFDWLMTNSNVKDNNYPYVAQKQKCNNDAPKTNIFAKKRKAVGKTV